MAYEKMMVNLGFEELHGLIWLGDQTWLLLVWLSPLFASHWLCLWPCVLAGLRGVDLADRYLKPALLEARAIYNVAVPYHFAVI